MPVLGLKGNSSPQSANALINAGLILGWRVVRWQGTFLPHAQSIGIQVICVQHPALDEICKGHNQEDPWQIKSIFPS
jgi:hypothetical protein